MSGPCSPATECGGAAARLKGNRGGRPADPDSWRTRTMPFGRHRLPDWPLDPAVTYLNHGTVGVAPRRVLMAQQAIRDEMERGPSQFLLRQVSGLVGAPTGRPSRLREAAGVIASFVGARRDDLVFVDNATTGA